MFDVDRVEVEALLLQSGYLTVTGSDASVHGSVVLVIDTTSSAAQLLMHTATQHRLPVAYVTGLAMRRAADLHARAAENRSQRRGRAS